MMGWILVRFTREKSGDVIPEGWLHKNKEQAYWPNCGMKEVQELIKNNEKVNTKWRKWKISLLSDIRYGTYDEAVKAFDQQCKTFQRMAEETDDESVLLKRKTKATAKPAVVSSLSIPFNLKTIKKASENEEHQKEKEDVISLENLNEDDNCSLTSYSDDNDRNEDSDKERESDGSISIINQNQMDPNTPTPPASNEENKDDNPNPLPSPVNQEENEGDGSAKEDTTKASNDDKSELNSNDLKEIKSLLLEIKTEVNHLNTVVDEKRYFDSKYDYAEIEELLPFCDDTKLGKFDQKIKEEKNYEYKVIKCFRTYGGSTERKIATKIMERLLTYPLASKFSMKGGKLKESFSVLNVYQTIIKVVKHTMTQPNEKEIDAAIDSFLRHAPDNVPTEEEERTVKKRKRTFQVKLPFYLTVKGKEKAVTDQAKEKALTNQAKGEVAAKKAKTNETTEPKTDPPSVEAGPSAVPLNIEVNKS
ncbi:unnamed protein product [Bemisia tabaci]|uniref:DUF4806 domain-containing protein n=1 Tax=Bemisia tabaci TaxID=7038 RepID=A0A9P0A5Z7_BEMTA|nr:unnamed protein product [Bemisia tabaci]